jgi:hypothetical protein
MAESIESGLVVTEQAAKASQIYYENFPWPIGYIIL